MANTVNKVDLTKLLSTFLGETVAGGTYDDVLQTLKKDKAGFEGSATDSKNFAIQVWSNLQDDMFLTTWDRFFKSNKVWNFADDTERDGTGTDEGLTVGDLSVSFSPTFSFSRCLTAGTSSSTWTSVAASPEVTDRNSVTGVITPTNLITVNADPTKFDFAGGLFQFVDSHTDPLNPTRDIITLGPQSGLTSTILLTSPVTSILIDKDGVFTYLDRTPTGEELREKANLAAIIHPTGSIIAIEFTPSFAWSTTNLARDMARSQGTRNDAGNRYIPNPAADLTFNKTPGRISGDCINGGDTANPNVKNTPVYDPVGTGDNILFYTYQSATPGMWINPLLTQIDPEFWDDGSGTLAAVPLGMFTIQTIYFTVPVNTAIHYGQKLYITFEDALAGITLDEALREINPATNPALHQENLIVQQGTLNLTDLAKAQFLEAGPGGGGSGGPGSDTDAIHDNVDGEISAITQKATPIGADHLLIEDSAASDAKKRILISSLPGGTDDDAIHDNVDGEISAITQKSTPVGADHLLIEDSAASDAKKRVLISDLPGGTDDDAIHDNVDGEISAIAQKVTPTGTDYLLIEDTAASNAKKRILISSLPSGTDDDAIHDNVNGEIAAVTQKVTPIGADHLLIEDSSASNAKKRILISSLPGGTDEDAIHDNINGEISSITQKVTPVGADHLLIEDSAASNAKKRVLVSSLPAIPSDLTKHFTSHSYEVSNSGDFYLLFGGSDSGSGNKADSITPSRSSTPEAYFFAGHDGRLIQVAISTETVGSQSDDVNIILRANDLTLETINLNFSSNRNQTAVFTSAAEFSKYDAMTIELDQVSDFDNWDEVVIMCTWELDTST